MKYLILSLCFAKILCADQLILDNQSSFSKIAVEWASSARLAQESNEALMRGEAIHPSKLHSPTSFQSKITIPAGASYFRVLAWKTPGAIPERLTNWVEIVPDKTYRLKNEHLTPTLLLSGMGC